MPRTLSMSIKTSLLALCLLASGAQADPGAAAPLGLRAAMALALAHDPQIVGARALVEAARAQTRQAQSLLWPRAGFTSSYGRSTDREPNPLDRTSERSEAFVRWNLFNGLQDRRQIASAQREQIAAEADWLRALDEACERLGSAYFELLRQQQLRVHAERRLAEVDTLAQRVARQAELGKSTDADAQLAAASRIDARLALQTVQTAQRAAELQLRVLLGASDERLLRVADEPPPPADAQQPLDIWQSQAQQQNGQWLAAAARAASARERIATLAPEYLPRLDLDLRRRLADRTEPAPTSAQQRGWSVGLTYEVPLGGAPRARQDELHARAEAAEADLQRVRDAVQADFGVTRQQALQVAAAAPQLTQQRAHWEAVVRASELQYDAGRRSLMQLIDQHDRRYGVEQREVDNAWQQATAQLRLRRLAGDLAEWFGVAGEALTTPR